MVLNNTHEAARAAPQMERPMSSGSNETRQDHDQNPPTPHGEQSEQGRSGEGAASAMQQMISQGERQRQALPSDGASGHGTGQS